MSLLHNVFTVLFAAVLSFASFAYSCKDKESCVALPDLDLYEAATNGKRVGQCYISGGGPRSYCDLYVNSANVGVDGSRGWPKDSNRRGTGCVKAPDFPKRRTTCWYTGSRTGLPEHVWKRFCTNNGRINAANQLRHAIEHDQCGLPSRAGQNVELGKLIPEAQISGWSCAHSPGTGSCFITTAVYVLNVFKTCKPCVESGGELSQPTDSTTVAVASSDLDTAKKCAACVQEVKKAPKCGGTILGIGSKHKGRSCKLIDGNGCWPGKSKRVLHDCGKGAECRFKVSNAKAKIWCCRPVQRCKWYQAKCHWQNSFRCSNSALSKSKDKNGAQVVWE